MNERPQDLGCQLTWVRVAIWVGLVLACAFLFIPSTSGLGPARVNAALHNAKQLGSILATYAAEHDGRYPDARTSTEVFQTLMTGKYLPNADSLLFLSPSAKVKWKWPGGEAPLRAENVCWDYTGYDPPGQAPFAGVPRDAEDGLPLLMSSGTTPGLRIGRPMEVPLTAPLPGSFPPGLVVLYKSGQAKFVKASAPGNSAQQLTVTHGFMPESYHDARVYSVRNP